MMIVERVLQNASGLHIRPAQIFMETASEFASEVKIRNEEGMEADGKSILGIMTIGFECGSKIVIETIGSDAEQAAAALLALIDSKFGEE